MINTIMNSVYQVEEELKHLDLSEKKISTIAMFIEEFGMHATERSEKSGKKIRLEITVTAGKDKIDLVIRDNGELVNVTDQGLELTSFRMYIISQLSDKLADTRYFIAGGENRTIISV